MNTIKALSILATTILFVACSKNEQTTCQIDDVNGVPRIKIDGKPVRTRMLYVSPTYFIPVAADGDRINSKWETKSFNVPAKNENLDTVVIQFKTKIEPMTYWISDFDIIEKKSGKKIYKMNFDSDTLDSRIAFWCKGIYQKKEKLPVVIKNEKIDNTSKSALRVEIQKSSPLLDGFHVYFKDIKLEANKEYIANLRVKCTGEKNNTFSYVMFQKEHGTYTKIAPEPKSNVEPQVRLARNVGIDVVTFPVQAEHYYIKEGETPDYSYLESALKSIVENNPNAKILVRIRFYPSAKWLKENPDSALTYSTGEKSTRFPSISSLKYREQSQNALRMIIDYAEKHYGKNIIGYHPGGGNSCEWFYPGSHHDKFSGYDESTQKAWNKWLLKKYASDTDLQKAWNIATAQRATDKVPTKEELKASQWLINPQTHRRIIDFNDFWNDEMIDMIESLADVIDEKVPNKLCVFFYGYCGDLSGAHNGFAYSGHAKLGKLLKNKKIDALCGPISYIDRYYGDGKSTQGASETITRAGKLWIDEDDTSTYLAPKGKKYPGFDGALDTREKTLQILTRNMAHEAVRNIGSWWMDLGGSGWFNDAELWKLKSAFKDAEEDIIRNGMQFSNDIALIFGEGSAQYCAANATSRWITSGAFGQARSILNRTGLTFGHYLLDDFLFGKPVDSKLDVYAVAYALTKKQRDAIKERTKKNASIFVWASGYVDIDNQKFSLEKVKDLTGFEMENVQDGKTKPFLHATELGKKIGLPETFSIIAIRRTPNPLLSPKLEKGDKVYATYDNGKPAYVLRGKTLYCGLPPVPAPMYREMARIAGIHIYTNIPSAIYTNGTYFSITPTDISDGESRDMVFTLPENKDILDALTGEKLGTKTFTKSVKKGDTFFIKIVK